LNKPSPNKSNSIERRIAKAAMSQIEAFVTTTATFISQRGALDFVNAPSVSINNKRRLTLV
jgi:hypothetical protein